MLIVLGAVLMTFWEKLIPIQTAPSAYLVLTTMTAPTGRTSTSGFIRITHFWGLPILPQGGHTIGILAGDPMDYSKTFWTTKLATLGTI
jgi:hypothetical protein